MTSSAIPKLKQAERVPLESTIEKQVCAYARARGLDAQKYTSPNRRSVPDRIFFGPDGLVFFIEFKRPGNKPTVKQDLEIERLRGYGIDVYVVDSIEEGKRIVDKYTKTA